VELARLDLPPDSPTHDFLQRIHESSVRARDLVRRLLTSTRPKAGRRSLTALPSVIHEVVNLLRATIPATTEIRSSSAPNVPPVHADATEIHQALLNLGTNASHALGHRPGWIEFALEAVLVRDRASAPHTDLSPGPYVRIRVRDNGTGIPAALLPRIFDPFFTTKAPGQGTGLGLSVVHGVMRANGGAVTVASTPGEGTTFELYFPAASGPLPPEPTTVAARSVPAARYSGRILFVDDEEPLVAVARRALAAAGFEVTACSRPSEALARFQADPHAFDLVLTDFAMPGMSGTALTEHLLRIRPDLPVVMTSGYIPAEEATAARRAGIRALHDKIEAFADLPRLVAPHLRPAP
jgi:CheY-like chemotaxis protein